MPKKPVNLDSPPNTHPLIWCLAVICTVVTVAVIILGMVVFIGYLVIRPSVPFVRVTYAHLDVFNFDQSGVLTTQLTIVINAENDNRRAHASFSDFRFVLSFNDINVASLELPEPLDVGNNQSVPLTFPVSANPIPLDLDQMTFADSSVKSNVIPFMLKGHTKARWRVGPFHSIRFMCHMNCLLQFQRDGSSPNPHCSSKNL